MSTSTTEVHKSSSAARRTSSGAWSIDLISSGSGIVEMSLSYGRAEPSANRSSVLARSIPTTRLPSRSASSCTSAPAKVW